MAPLNIKLVKKRPPLFESFEESWKVIQEALENIFQDKVSIVSFERIYRVVYDMVQLGDGAKLYSKLSKYLNDKLTVLRDDRLVNSKDSTIEKSPISYIHVLNDFWLSHNNYFKLIGNLMIYFDKVYSIPLKKKQVVDLCYSFFASTILLPLSDKLLNAFLATINEIRNELIDAEDTTSILEGKTSLLSQLKSLVDMMELITAGDGDISFYKEKFEPFLLDETKVFYSDTFHWSSLPALEAYYTIQLLIPAEKGLTKNCFNDDTCRKIQDILEEVLIDGKAKPMVKELISTAMVKQDKTLLEDIMNLSVNNTDYINAAYDAIKEYIFTDLKESIHIVEVLKRRSLVGTKWTSDVGEKRHHYLRLLDIYYPNEKDASNNIIDVAFSKYLNLDSKQSIEFLCYFLDSKLKTVSSPSLTLETIIGDVDFVVNLLKGLPDKDSFVETYRSMLCKRLLHQRYTLEWETNLLKKLSNEIGSYLTVNIETMLKDITISGHLARSMEAMLGKNNLSNGVSAFDFYPNVLTMTAWPFDAMNEQEEEELILPNLLRKYLEEFEVVYKKRYSQRILKWCHSLGLVEVTYWFGNNEKLRRYDLVLPFHSAIVFFLLAAENEDQHEPWTQNRIQRATGLPLSEVTRQLVSLSIAPRFRILKKTPETSIIEPTDVFSINEDFRSPTQTVRIKTVNISSGSASNSAHSGVVIQKSLERDRFVVTNAAIVRIMKQQKTLTEKELFSQCQAALKPRFSLQDKTFKHSIHHLIDKEYLVNDPDDRELYRYL